MHSFIHSLLHEDCCFRTWGFSVMFHFYNFKCWTIFVIIFTLCFYSSYLVLRVRLYIKPSYCIVDSLDWVSYGGFHIYTLEQLPTGSKLLHFHIYFSTVSSLPIITKTYSLVKFMDELIWPRGLIVLRWVAGVHCVHYIGEKDCTVRFATGAIWEIPD